MDTQAKVRQQLEMKRVTLEVLQEIAAEHTRQIQAIAGSGDAYRMAAQLPLIVQRLDVTLRELTAYKTAVDMLANILKLEVVKMFCPLSPIRPQTEKPRECGREHCAWYNAEAQMCAVLTISKAAQAMAGRMD